jgi:ketosteroid isomerase-like protein
MVIASLAVIAVIYLNRDNGVSTAEAASRPRLKVREDQYTQGIIEKDIQLLSGVFAENFVDTFATGQIVTKKQYLALIKADTSEIESLDVEEQNVQFYADTAIVTAKFMLKGQDQGKPFTETGRSTDVWVWMKDDWFCVAAHSSSLKE